MMFFSAKQSPSQRAQVGSTDRMAGEGYSQSAILMLGIRQ